MNSHPACWLNGKIVNSSEARISVLDHGLLYGDGVFEGIRYYGRTPFLLQTHLQRLEKSARAILLSVPYDFETLTYAIKETIAEADIDDGYLRLVVTRGIGPLGLDPRRCEQPNTFILASPLTMVSEEARASGARVIIAATRRLSIDGLDPQVKSLNYLNHILARIEASNANADEAIMLNQQGRVAEGTADNLFIVREGTLLTPPVIDGALAGITRATILELARMASIPTHEISLAPYDLYTADECFLTGTGAELIPVREIDGRPLRNCPGSVYKLLLAKYRQLIAHECQTGL
jgi:branched-chain amino acid aminotransferase